MECIVLATPKKGRRGAEQGTSGLVRKLQSQIDYKLSKMVKYLNVKSVHSILCEYISVYIEFTIYYYIPTIARKSENRTSPSGRPIIIRLPVYFPESL